MAVALIILVGIAFAVFLMSRGPSPICPRCHAKALVRLCAIKATVVVDGRSAPDHWAFYKCGSCGARLKDHHGEWETPTEHETTAFFLEDRGGAA